MITVLKWKSNSCHV